MLAKKNVVEEKKKENLPDFFFAVCPVIEHKHRFNEGSTDVAWTDIVAEKEIWTGLVQDFRHCKIVVPGKSKKSKVESRKSKVETLKK